MKILNKKSEIIEILNEIQRGKVWQKKKALNSQIYQFTKKKTLFHKMKT